MKHFNGQWQELIDKAKSPYYIRTSDRINFRGCKRHWSWATGTGIMGGRESREIAPPLWLGTGVHFALEDYHGYKKYSSSVEAFEDFVHATHAKGKAPDNHEEYLDQGIEMLRYYELWLDQPGRPVYKTLRINDEPAVEVSFEIPLLHIDDDYYPLDSNLKTAMIESETDLLVYRGTIDRLAIDDMGLVWIFEYKTAARYEYFHLETDPQVTAYLWALSKIFPQLPIGGVVYQQHHKTPPRPPRVLSNGSLSTAQTQNTSGLLYRQALEGLYRDVSRAPRPQQEFYGKLLVQESENQDRGVRWDLATRSKTQLEAEERKILHELEDMLSANYMKIYPSPTRKCTWCDFKEACVAKDSGYDYQDVLKNTTQQRSAYGDESWKFFLRAF